MRNCVIIHPLHLELETALGINHDTHFRVETEAEWHSIGHRLAPKEIWKGVLIDPGMVGLTMRGQRPDEHKGALIVRVEPSDKIKPGVFVNVNDHYELQSLEPSQGADQILNLLETSWSISVARSRNISETIVGLK